MKRLSAILLCSLLLIMSVVSCAAKDGGTTERTESESVLSTESGGETTTSEPTNIDIAKAAYGDTSYDGYVFRVLSPNPGKHFYSKTSEIANEIYFEAETGDVLNDSIYQRNAMTEELLNITITPVFGGDTGDITSTTKKTVLAGSDSFDCAINRLDYQMNLSSENLLYNLMISWRWT